ncbi:hypothetical protein [Streptomyces mirabilis]|uniref:hypothetical protein n=1 Tax=Streptomyces mirabilis TaxID=68239 RepID=UPI0038021376
MFTKNVGKLAMQTRMSEVGELTRGHWRGEWNADYAPEGERPDGYRDYKGTVPLLATTLRLLAANGPHGPVWWRYGRTAWQTPGDALDNPDDYRAYSVRDQARRTAREVELERARREREEERRRMEAGKWVCPTCRRYVYPDDGLTSGGECRPCLNYRERAAAEAVQEQPVQPVQPPSGGGVFGWRRRT